jgi:MinD superfamily P-loop ATPase
VSLIIALVGCHLRTSLSPVGKRLKGTDWGDLDVLILDLPPGTGDVQLTVCQDLDLSGAVGVTTPSKLAIADARKGIEMFSQLGVPTLAMVENMAYFEVSEAIDKGSIETSTILTCLSHTHNVPTNLSAKVARNTIHSGRASRNLWMTFR